MKRCVKCCIPKPETEFYRNSRLPGGAFHVCKSCHRAFAKARFDSRPGLAAKNSSDYRKRNPGRAAEDGRKWRAENPEKSKSGRRPRHLRIYGLTEESFQQIFSSQRGRCKVCQKSIGGSIKFHIDHCHKTGVVRGILCPTCNFGLGSFHDSPEKLRAAADYLETFSKGMVPVES